MIIALMSKIWFDIISEVSFAKSFNIFILLSYKTTLKNKNRGLFQNIQLSIVIMVFGIVIYSLIAVKSFGISSTISDNSTLNDVIDLTNKGVSLNQIGKFNDSISLFNKALSIEPKNILALTEKANALGGLGNYPVAIVYYDKVLDIDPKNVPALDNKGLSLYHLGNYTQAISYYDKGFIFRSKTCSCII
jgi:tetratricopeptide (TPR) repeat protein